jgi:uncharacterized protein YfdQ (DUF2303 family)
MSNTEAYSLAVKQIADLATDAHGLEITNIFNIAKGHGLPENIPVGLIRGDEPSFQSVKSLIEEWRTRPDAKKGVARVLTLDSFISLTIRHQTDDSVIFADTNWEKPSLTAIVDYHEAKTAGDPDNCKHRVHYAFPLSVEWKAWIEANGKPMKQGDFAAFIEDRIADLTSPNEDERFTAEELFATTAATPAELVTLSRGLQVNVESKVRNATTLSSGEAQIVFEEEHRDASGGKLRVPGLFFLNVAPFFAGEKARIPVRLRYRVAEGRLLWFYQIYRPDVVVTERVRADLGAAVEQTSLPAYEGAPEISA